MTRTRLRLLLGVYAVFILTLTHIPNTPKPGLVRGEDKVLHVLLYLPLGALAKASVASAHIGGSLGLIAAAAGFAAIDEGTQLFVPGRQASLFDALADIVGFSIGIASVSLRQRRSSR